MNRIGKSFSWVIISNNYGQLVASNYVTIIGQLIGEITEKTGKMQPVAFVFERSVFAPSVLSFLSLS